MSTFNLPDLGEGLQEAEIVAWHVGPGDNVVADQPIVSVETDKAVVEIPAPRAGRIARLCAEAGEVLPIGAALVEYEDGPASDTGVIVGEAAREAVSLEAERPVPSRAAPSGRPAGSATPAVRALARRLGVDLAAVTGTGPDGAILSADVEAAAEGRAEAPPAAAEAAAAAPAPAPAGERLRGVRRAMARKMIESHRAVVPATVNEEVDVGDWPAGSDVTIQLVRAIASACAAAPALNAWFDGANETRRLLERVDLGIAVHTDDGLFVPVLRDIGGRAEADLRAGLERMKADVRSRSIPPEELQGATITLSNFGIFGAGRFAQLVIVPPQVAIIGAGRIAPHVVATEDGPAVRRTLPLSLTFDHRVVNGGEAASFLAALIKSLGRAA